MKSIPKNRPDLAAYRAAIIAAAAPAPVVPVAATRPAATGLAVFPK